MFQAFRASTEVVARTLVATIALPRTDKLDRVAAKPADKVIGCKYTI